MSRPAQLFHARNDDASGATAAARLVLHYAATHLPLAEIRAEVLQRNPASQRLMHKLGFRLLRSIPDADPYSIHTLPIPRRNKRDPALDFV